MTSGQTISHYRIVDKLGEGGMGVVYKAEDQRLKRTVALKFLPARQGVSEEDKERFLREAQAAAGLDHPNICTVYEIDEADGRLFMAMAFVEGKPLDERIEEGPLALGEAVEIARQAAEGLRAAHQKGVVHRDIKSSNLMISGTASRPRVKILDFGLAQLSGRSKITQAASVLGTVAYMSPEQTQGATVDRRADIWALGVVLYEMVAGELPFKGHYDQATMYSILNEDPEPLTAVRARIPVELDWIVDKCMAKSPDERYQSADELILDLTTLQKKLSSERLSIHRSQVLPPEEKPSLLQPRMPSPRPPAAAEHERRELAKKVRRQRWAVVFLALLSLWALAGRKPPEAAGDAQSVRRFDINLPRSLPQGVQLRDLAVSPDGRRLAFVTSEQDGRLWVRDLSQAVARSIEGTEGVTHVFWSPDSLWIGYHADREIRKVDARGGPSTTLCAVSNSFFTGADWSPDGATIVFGSGPPFELQEVSSVGGAPKVLMAGDSGGRRGFPADMRLLEDSAGRRLLLAASRTRGGEQLGLFDLESGDSVPLGSGAAPFYAGDYIFYQPNRAAEIWAMPFSLDKREATGDPFPVAQGGRRPTVSDDGALVYIDDALAGGPRRLVWRDRTGELVGEIGSAHIGMRSPRVSPDGLQVAVTAMDSGGSDVWIHAEGRATNRRLTVHEKDDGFPIWSADGDRIVFSSNRDGRSSLYVHNADGSGSAKLLYSSSAYLSAIDWSRDGKIILVRARTPGRGGISYLRRTASGDYELETFLEGVFGANEAQLSPDGKYIVYETRSEGEARVYVQPFPEGGQQWQVSADTGESPRWSADGREIFYLRGGTMVAAEVDARNGFRVKDSVDLFSHPALEGGPRSSGYDVSPDGQRFAMIEPVGTPPPPTIRVVLNWHSEFAAR